MNRAVITGLGFITSIGNGREEVLRSLRETRTGVELFSEFADPAIPVKLAGTVKGFAFPSADFEDWTFPTTHKISRETLPPMTPNALYAYFAMLEAIADAGLPADLVSDPDTGLVCASGGSMWLAYVNLDIMLRRGVQRCPPMSIVNSIPGSLYINLVPTFGIKGTSLGVSSACASSAHALGLALDLIRTGRQKRVFVVGAEDCNKFIILPFASVRALSVQTDPAKSPCAFDVKRDGFVGTGGAAVLVVEDLELARARSVPHVYAEVLGWGESSDGYNVLAPDPTGDGLARAMQRALADAQVQPGEVDYLNAHATSTPFGDAAEIAAIKQIFNQGHVPLVSSTKSLTGHGLSLAGAMEAGFTCLALHDGFVPVSAHITELDPICAGVPIVTAPVSQRPELAMTNSSGFGGTNVSILLRKLEDAV
ncbi:MAG: beta-ketoacyl-[acyl-carrier-protein] synthase family protein [Verrucomicrobia bacterium]|nr:beta-ketoacyl-[acyl-carrier-protein] synthase family protein [Verrucomicrobiota bacterium]